MAPKFDMNIDQIAITMSTNISGQTDLELTSDMFATDAPSNFKTEKYPFISDTVLLNEAVLQTKLYPELLRIFFMRDEFYTFNRDNRTIIVKLNEKDDAVNQNNQVEMVTKNINIMIRCLFDTYPTLSNYTNSLYGTFETSLSIKTHKYSYLVIGSKVYTVARIVWINDIFEHPVYETFVINYNKFERWREGEVKNINNTNKKQLANMEKTLKDFHDSKDMDTLTEDISKLESYAANKNNWTGRGASDVVKRNAMVILGKYLKHIATGLGHASKLRTHGGGKDDPIKIAYDKEKKINEKFNTTTKKLLEKYLKLFDDNIRTDISKSKKTSKSDRIKADVKELDNWIETSIEKIEDLEESNLIKLIEEMGIDTKDYNTDKEDETISKNVKAIYDFFRKTKQNITIIEKNIDTYKNANPPLPNRQDINGVIQKRMELLLKIKDPIIQNITDILEQLKLKDAKLSKVQKDILDKPKPVDKPAISKIVLEPELDIEKDEISKKEIDTKIEKVSITDPDFLSELNRTYKIIIDSNILPLSLAVKTLIKDITEKNQKIVKLQEVIKYLDTDMLENFKKIEYDNPSYNTLIETVFGDKRKISKMINHTINEPGAELKKEALDGLANDIQTQTNETKYSGPKKYVTGISYDNTAVDKPRYSIYMFVDFIDGKADDANHNLELCSFRDELLYNDLTIMSSNKVQKTIHDPLIQLVKATAITAGTRRKRSKTSRRTRKNRW